MRGRNATVSFRVFELTINHQKYRKIGIIGSELSKCQESGAKHAYAGAHRVVENSLDCSIFQCDQSFFEFAFRKKTIKTKFSLQNCAMVEKRTILVIWLRLYIFLGIKLSFFSR